MIHPERGVTIEAWAVVSDATSVEYLVSRDGEAVEFSLGQSSRTSGPVSYTHLTLPTIYSV